MHNAFRVRFGISVSDNRKSKIQNRKWVGCLAILLLLTGWVRMVDAQQTGKIARIGFLDVSTASGSAVLVEAFRQELRKLGWVEGKNFIIEYRFAEQKSERVPDLAAELVRLKFDLIVATGGLHALAAKGATTTIPIVMASTVGDPVALGLVASLARPGGNVTGLSSLSIEIGTKRLEILKDAVPKLARVGVLMVPANRQVKELRPTAVALKLKLEEIETQYDAKGLESAFQTDKAETGQRDYDDGRSPLFRRKKADRRACRQIPVTGYLPREGVCR